MTKQANARIPYSVTGSGPDTLLFIHGFLDSKEVWSPVVDKLGEAKHVFVTLDLPGMGELNDENGEISLERYRDDVVSVLKAISTDVVIVAQSMGAQIAELVAIAVPERVRGLVLVTPVPLGGVNAPEDVVKDFYALGGNPDAQRNVRSHLSPNLPSQKLDALTLLGENVSSETVSALVDAWNNGIPDAKLESSYAGPVLVVRGESDPFVTEAMADGVSARFKGTRQLVIPRAGHWAHFEDPASLAQSISDLLALLGTSGASDWKGAFSQKSSTAFADAFDPEVTLEAATLYKPVVGRDQVKNVMEAASRIYEKLEFTEQSTGPGKQYLEWRAVAFGGVDISGVTVITRNGEGRIANIAIHHRPLSAALKFSYELGSRLRGIVPPEHFAASPAIEG